MTPASAGLGRRCNGAAGEATGEDAADAERGRGVIDGVVVEGMVVFSSAMSFGSGERGADRFVADGVVEMIVGLVVADVDVDVDECCLGEVSLRCKD
jgi:hypothetical protein